MKKRLPSQGIAAARAAAMRKLRCSARGSQWLTSSCCGSYQQSHSFDLLGKLKNKQVGMSISILAVIDAFTRDQIHT
jgi:hypothetical protein